MIRSGNKIRLTRAEQAFLSGLSLEPVNPQTVEDYNAWMDASIEHFADESDPEQRLFKAVLQGMRIEG
jgi:hypothetical protein